LRIRDLLIERVEGLLEGVPLARLQGAFLSLSEGYRSEKNSRAFFSERELLLAYLITRMPATFAAISKCLLQIPFEVKRVVDWGAGPGTGMWAASERFGEVEGTLIEQSKEAIEIGKFLALHEWKWLKMSLEKAELPSADLAILSYVLGEGVSFEVLEKWRKAAIEGLLVIEPGTPRGFERVLEVRKWALQQGLFVIAPCPHDLACPSRWCHFSVRVERSRMHRLLKGGSLGFEDEKFSYVIVSKNRHPRGSARIVGPPELFSLEICADGKLEKVRVSKKEAKRYEWGDVFARS
jgi:ribosomal protein RSM22 (predicted rRNA methylase)